MNDVERCPRCGAKYPDHAPQGPCPQCLMRQGLDTESELSAETFESASTPPEAGFRALRPTQAPMVPGQMFGPYRVHRLLGRGGMGQVYEVEHVENGRRLAVKVLNEACASEVDKKRFLREGRVAASVSHPNCVYVYGTEEIEGAPVISMELAHGGTLHERVKRDGPIPVEEAVDAVLQLIAGLEAAEAAGILHRDIKPSNCFVDTQGQVKIGDFGLSITTILKEQTQLTKSGSFVGTPVYASPEQLRGEDLDVRSDIYSLGGTLYYLLTGKVPFDSDNMVNLVALILDRQADPPKKLRSQIPAGLSQVIMRCLEKEPGQRFSNYADLRKALLPYCSTVPAPAPLGKRFMAGIVDHILLVTFLSWPINLLMGAFVYSREDVGYTAGSYFVSNTLNVLVVNVVLILYYSVSEGLWGASIGKAALRLRTVDRKQRVPGFKKALIRATVFKFIPALATLLLAMSALALSDSPGMYIAPALIGPVCTLLLFSTMRHTNRYAAIHGLLSGTRVVVKRAASARRVEPYAGMTVPSTPAVASIGPYSLSSSLPAPHELPAVVQGHDPILRRKVWLHLLPAGTAPVTSARRDVSRPGRPHWLNGERAGELCWDAYEAPTGKPLLERIADSQSWSIVRGWLLDLAEELDASLADGTLPPAIDMNRVWITEGDRAKLLDFPAPGLAESQSASTCLRDSEVNHESIQGFLLDVAVSALEGRLLARNDPFIVRPEWRLPLHACDFLRTLDKRGYRDVNAALETLKFHINDVATVSRMKRLGHMACFQFPFMLLAISAGYATVFTSQLNKKYPTEEAMRVLGRLDEIETAAASGDQDAVEEEKELEAYFASRFGDMISDPMFRSQMIVEQAALKRAERIVSTHPDHSDDMVAAGEQRARALREAASQEHASGTRSHIASHGNIVLFGLTVGVLMWLCVTAPVSAFAFRGGFLFTVFGIRVVTRHGVRASRVRCLWRGLVTWAPVYGWVVMLFTVLPIAHRGIGKVAFAGIAILFLYGIVAAVVRERSFQDRFAGTYLVAK